jgi:dethiobiotin synthetase
MKKIPGVFITGTDTGVGKTFIAAKLIRSLVKNGIRAVPLKPIETGCPVKDDKLNSVDAIELKKAAQVDVPLELVNPYTFQYPLAPSVACELEGRRIEIEKIKDVFYTLSRQFDFVVVEGAGGLMVPIVGAYFFADLAYDMALPLIVITRPGLGTINHTLLTVQAARSWGLNLFGIVINYSEPATNSLAEKTNPTVIDLLSGVPILGIVPFSKFSNQKTEHIFDSISARLIQYFDLSCNGQPHVEHKNIIKTVSLRGGVFLPTKQSR